MELIQTSLGRWFNSGSKEYFFGLYYFNFIFILYLRGLFQSNFVSFPKQLNGGSKMFEIPFLEKVFANDTDSGLFAKCEFVIV